MGLLDRLFKRKTATSKEAAEKEPPALEVPPDRADTSFVWSAASTREKDDFLRAHLTRINRYLNEDELQNEFHPPALKDMIMNGPAIDQVEDPSGEFGRSRDNPIPVNGPLGESTYLSRLRFASNGQKLMYHRLGCLGGGLRLVVNVYETATWDGLHWDILYFEMYHPVKTRLAPEGYEFDKIVVGLSGTTQLLPTFPKGIITAVAEGAMQLIGFPAREPMMRRYEAMEELKRPAEQEAAVEQVMAEIKKLRDKVSN